MLDLAPVKTPFTILVDSNESQPWTFQGINADADKDGRPWLVDYRFCSLGRFPHSRGDYSLEGHTHRVAVERKSLEDVWATVLGWETEYEKKRGGPGRRQRFERELENLASLEAAMVVVEATLGTCLACVPEWGDKPPETNRKIWNRSVIAYIQDYRVPWLFCDSRRMAEVETFRFLARWWRKHGKD